MLYFIKAENSIKIGFTDSPVSRVSTIQVSVACYAEVLLLIDGTRVDEKQLHRQFHAHRTHGEWFDICPELMTYIDDNMHRDRRYEFGLIKDTSFAGNNQLARIRHEARVTAKQLGLMLNVAQQAVAATEKRELKGALTLSTMRRTAEALGYTFEYRFVKNN